MKTIPDLTEKDIDRFLSKIYLGKNDCWEFSTKKDAYGYPQIRIQKKTYKAHRVAYKFFVRREPGKLCVCHACDNPGCVNPFHLFLGTRLDNNRDMVSKGRDKNNFSYKNRVKTHCKYGHEFTPENTRIYLNSRYCRECYKKWNKEYYERSKTAVGTPKESN